MKPELAENHAPGKTPFRLPSMRRRPEKDPRAEYRDAQRERAEKADSMAITYPQLKSLKVTLEFVNRDIIARKTRMKYSANPEHAKSVLVFACPTDGCMGGDFDLTHQLADAVAARRTKITGNMCCPGIHKKGTGEVASCRSELHFVFNLTYSKKERRT
jgi:hypothetical protein